MNIKLNSENLLTNEDFLFHYTKLNTGIEKILYNGNLRLSHLKTTNDPRENKDHLFMLVSREKDRKQALEYLHSIEKELNYLSKSKVRISCFCSNNIENGNSNISGGWEKSRMWSQYGEDHRDHFLGA